jgi:hypothetical protein
MTQPDFSGYTLYLAGHAHIDLGCRRYWSRSRGRT